MSSLDKFSQLNSMSELAVHCCMIYLEETYLTHIHTPAEARAWPMMSLIT